MAENEQLNVKIQEWLEWDKNDTTKKEIQKLVAAKDVAELEKRLLARIEFGTAGMRSRMAAGNSMMNDLTIIQATQGLTKHLLDTCQSAKSMGVVIGYDARHNSKHWSNLTAAVLISQGVPVYLFSQVCPTPYVPFSVTHYRAACGIMITASHNPKEDNGYKVYWTNGAQIIPPTDKEITKAILENLKPWENSWNTDLTKSNLCKDPYDEILKKYNEKLLKNVSISPSENTSAPEITYTAMHGVGYHYIQEAFKATGIRPPIPVNEQVQPDPDFPTVKYPNPEEGKGALLLSMQTAEKNASKIILANDPDADRLAVAEQQPNGDWKIFTGNEIGALLGLWCWQAFQRKHPNISPSDVYMIASTVSSKIMKSVGLVEGFNFVETLTGFKWMGNKAVELMGKDKYVPFAFEEAIGFMVGCEVLDKDGISAAAVELARSLYQDGKTLNSQLEHIYETYGYHLSSNSYFICHDKNIINTMFENIRNFNGELGKYPTSCGPYRIRDVRDLTGVGYDSTKPDHKPDLPTSSSQMITFTFENGCVTTLRTSGTEPKIKYYTEHCPDKSIGMSRAAAVEELNDIVDNIVTNFFQPERYGLIPKAD